MQCSKGLMDGGFVLNACFVMYIVLQCSFLICHSLAEEERSGCFTYFNCVLAVV